MLFANEPRAYRDVLASAVTLLRPDAEVIEVDPDELDAAIAHHVPALVVCDRITAAVEGGGHHWVLLYPDGGSFALVGHGARWRRVPAPTLDDLLGIVSDVLGPPPSVPNGAG